MSGLLFLQGKGAYFIVGYKPFLEEDRKSSDENELFLTMDKLGPFFTLHFVVAFMRCFGDRLAVLRWTRIVFAEHFRYHHPHPYE